MFVFNQEHLVEALAGQEGVDLVSYGKPRDAFELETAIPHWTSGFGGKYEMVHKNVPAGTMIAIGNLEDLDVNDQAKLKEQLKVIDIYPTGHSGDFTGQNVATLKAWFDARSKLDNDVNNQTPIIHAKKLTAAGLGTDRYNDLVGYLADEMNLFKNPDAAGALVPADKSERVKIVIDLLDGLSKAVRYTRMDEPAKAYQLKAETWIEKKDKGSIVMTMREEAKILVMRTYKNGETDVTPLDRSMIGRTYVTKDGQPLGQRGEVDISMIAAKVEEIENRETGAPARAAPSYIRPTLAAKP